MPQNRTGVQLLFSDGVSWGKMDELDQTRYTIFNGFADLLIAMRPMIDVTLKPDDSVGMEAEQFYEFV